MLRFSKLPLVSALLLSLGLTLMSATVGIAHAEAPMVKTQAPGYQRFMLGDFEITALSDGTVKLPMLKLLQGNPAQLAEALRRGFLRETVETSVNGYLVNTGKKLVLIDTGAAGLFGPTLGNLQANLVASGYKAEQVDEIYITHMHPDHVGGLVKDGKIAFPNAILRIDQHDVDFWLSKANLDAAPESSKGFFQGAQASVNPYVAAGKLKPFSGSLELVPGIRSVSTYGHTPGHTVYQIESQGEKLVLWGDLMHVAAVQFEDPSVTIAFDSDAKSAQGQREKAFADAASGAYLVGGSHIAFPGVGNLRATGNGKGYVWVPLNYSGLK